jgi:hydroxyacylglutathione hydrolase
MFVQQFFVKGLAHSSYLLGGSEACAIVDPRRDVQVYIDAAEDMGMKITHILETHLHADFVSGHMDLAQLTGATIVAPKEGNCSFEHVAVAGGDTFEIEDLKIDVLDTPGHTPEHISFVATDTSRGDEPAAVFCGDTLFVGDVGRPDLFPGMAQELASKLFSSLHDKLLKLPDHCEVYPAHGAGSLCGRAMGAKRTSTIGYERRYNAALQIADEAEFIKSLTENMPGAPDHFARCSAINGGGPALVAGLAEAGPLTADAFEAKLSDGETIVLDIRGYDAFGGQHIAGAYHIDVGGNFATFAGWTLPPDKDILLVSFTPDDAQLATMWLRRVGLDRVVGYLKGEMFQWAKAAKATAHVCQLSTPEVHDLSVGEDEIVIVDVRAPSEFGAMNIEGALNIPAPELRTRHAELDPTKRTVLICSTGLRSSLATSLLLQAGFEHVHNAAGGMTAYATKYENRECPMCVTPHGSKFLG